MEEPEVLQPMGLQRVGHDLVTEHTHTHSSSYQSPSLETISVTNSFYLLEINKYK